MTTIAIDNETWKKLNELKESPKDTYDDIINKLLNKTKDKGGRIK